MLLILTNSQDATTEYLVSVLQANDVAFLRFDTDTALSKLKFTYRTNVPILEFDKRSYNPNSFTNVWYRRPEVLKSESLDNSPEGKFIIGEWTEALEGFFGHFPKNIWMNHPSCNVVASHKVEQLSTASSVGFDVPDTLVTQDACTLRAFAKQHKRIIAKPMASGHIQRESDGENDSLIYTNEVKESAFHNLDDLSVCPTLFQKYIEKRSDVRITVIDNDIHAVEMKAHELDGSQRCDIRRNNMEDVVYRTTELPNEVSKRVSKLMRRYSLRFAAIDMAIGTDEKWYFFEINPNGQWAWLDLVGGLNIAGSFVEAFRG